MLTTAQHGFGHCFSLLPPDLEGPKPSPKGLNLKDLAAGFPFKDHCIQGLKLGFTANNFSKEIGNIGEISAGTSKFSKENTIIAL